MEEPVTQHRRRRLGLVAALAAVAVVLVLAVAAWADTGGGSNAARGSGDSGSSLPVQSDRSQERERGWDCPEKDGRSSGETAPSTLEL